MSSDWPLLSLRLRVLDLARESDFYGRLGLTELDRSIDSVDLGTPDGRVLLQLRQLEGGQPRAPRTAGLFHFAILLPDEGSVGSFLRHCRHTGIPLTGAADHLVSQALYLDDPEGNGIEIYCDRPESAWSWDGGLVHMDTLALNIPRLLGLGGAWEGFPPGTVLGHMHLTVADLDQSQRFYEGGGMRVTANWGPFRFMSWDGYHHHLGLNLAHGVGAPAQAADQAGLESFGVSAERGLSGLDPARIEVTQG